MLLIRRFFSALAVLVLMEAVAYADCIPISNIPYTISQSGSYCVTADLSIDLTTTGTPAILLQASHVDLDFFGHSLTQTGDASAQYATNGNGIAFYATDGISTDVVIHNGTLKGFQWGVLFTVASNATEFSNITVENMTIQNSTLGGISVDGSNVKILNNTVSNTRNFGTAYGISVHSGPYPSLKASNRAVVQGNKVSTISAQYVMALGIEVNSFADTLIRDNTISNVWVRTPSDQSVALGIQVSQANGYCGNSCNSDPVGGLIIQDNTVTAVPVVSRISGTHSTGIRICYPSDHAIVTGSKIAFMGTGIDAICWGTLNNTPPVLLLNNTITSTSIPVKGGIALPQ